MKKTLSWLIALMVVASAALVGCEKDRGGGGGGSGSGGKLLTKVTLAEDQRIEGQAQIEWDGSLIKRVIVYSAEDGYYEAMGEAVPNYQNGRLKSIYVESYEEGGGYTLNCTYNSDDQLVSVSLPESSPLQISYDIDGNIYRLSVDGEGVALTWEDGNIVQGREIGSSDYIKLTYDNSYNPLNDVLSSLIQGFAPTLNCPTYVSNRDGETIKLNYKMDGNYPARVSAEDITVWFEYADGSGERAPDPVPYYEVWGHAYDWEGGYVEVSDDYVAAGTTVTLTAVPYSGYSFVRWQDGNTQNPRAVTVNADAEYVAYFSQGGSGGGSSTSNSVVFGSYAWDNVSVEECLYYGTYNVLLYAVQSDGNNFPYIWLYIDNPSSTGYHSLSANDNGVLDDYWRIDYFENTYLTSEQDGNTYYYGDWWAKTASVNITSYNFGTKKVSLTINATMFSAEEAFVDGVDIDAASTRSLSLTLNNVSFTEYQQTAVAARHLSPRRPAGRISRANGMAHRG